MNGNSSLMTVPFARKQNKIFLLSILHAFFNTAKQKNPAGAGFIINIIKRPKYYLIVFTKAAKASG